MEANQLPTKVGPYYWRESEGDEFQLVRVELHLYNRNPDVVHLSCYSGKEMRMLPIKDMQGQWFQIPTAEELVELRAIKKMVDEGVEAWGVFDKNKNIQCIGYSSLQAKEMFMGTPVTLALKEVEHLWVAEEENGYTCEPVTIIRKAKR